MLVERLDELVWNSPINISKFQRDLSHGVSQNPNSSRDINDYIYSHLLPQNRVNDLNGINYHNTMCELGFYCMH